LKELEGSLERTTVSFNTREPYKQLRTVSGQLPINILKCKYEDKSIVQIDESINDYDCIN